MTKIKFKFHQKPLSDEQISSFKNFDSLMTAFVAAPKPSLQYRLTHNRFFIYTTGIMSGIILTTIATFFILKTETTQLSQTQNTISSKPVSGITTQNISKENSVELNSSIRNSDEIKNPASEISKEKKEQVVIKTSSKENKIEEQKQSKTFSQSIISNPNNNVSFSKKSDENFDENISSSKNKTPTVTVQDGGIMGEAPAVLTTSDSAITFTWQLSEEQTQNLLSLNDSEKASEQNSIPENKNTTENNSSENSTVTPLASEQNEIQNDDTLHRLKETVTQLTKAVDTVAAQTIQQSKESYTWITTKLNGMMTKGFSRKNKNSTSLLEEKSDSTINRPAQVSFFFPIGSNGINSGRYSNNFSLNMLWGFNGGVKGAEIGGLVNVDRKNVSGAQIGGLINLTFGNLKGAQIGGLVNQAKNVEGAQVGGLVNSSLGKMKGFQIGGLINFALDTMYGTQIGGLLNLSTTRSPSVGLQLGGLGNLSTGKLDGSQISGLLNVANIINGTQISGLLNVAAKVNGSQISFINIGWKVHGFQLGFINISDSLKGVPIGFLSISRNGLFKVDVFNTDFSNANVGFRCGSNQFYNIFAIGISPNTSHGNRYSFGYGIGTHFTFSKKIFMNLDAISWSVHYNNLREWNGINMVNQLRPLPGWQIAKRFGVYAGPVVNVEVIDDSQVSAVKSHIYTAHGAGSTGVNGWIGWTVGWQFF